MDSPRERRRLAKNETTGLSRPPAYYPVAGLLVAAVVFVASASANVVVGILSYGGAEASVGDRLLGFLRVVLGVVGVLVVVLSAKYLAGTWAVLEARKRFEYGSWNVLFVNKRIAADLRLCSVDIRPRFSNSYVIIELNDNGIRFLAWSGRLVERGRIDWTSVERLEYSTMIDWSRRLPTIRLSTRQAEIDLAIASRTPPFYPASRVRMELFMHSLQQKIARRR